MRFLFCITASLALLISCQQNSNQIPTVGSFDSLAIAMDTAMQKGFESSYEFHKTLVANDTQVYDVVAYGGSAKQGEYAILRRGADNKTDTITVGKREGVIADAYLADSNKNRHSEIYIVIQNSTSSELKKTLRFED